MRYYLNVLTSLAGIMYLTRMLTEGSNVPHDEVITKDKKRKLRWFCVDDHTSQRETKKNEEADIRRD